ncbi:hypothetical protein CENA302_06040 [Cylindrospermopsis raciborskii CENA302]|uniref:Uncharacterized protein n=1 Tax=Cylindrospermopsis raciborskii CENA302 TaxID=1170768 RepID=A0A9Q5QXF7_9CYAN|nr:hypothetical protein BCV64_10265 [Cylindrospermopsis raciborskii MVCC14]OPH10173.1 hypothetical protein CENA302_06040 [Cylindrospermopsis raciborskii CENA302]
MRRFGEVLLRGFDGEAIALLIVVANSNEPRYRRARQAYKVLQNIGVRIDVIVMTREEVERKVNVPISLVSRIVHEGKLLYKA